MKQLPTLVFTYGTLKEGFCNHGVNDGVRVPGDFETAECYPLYLVGPFFLPWLVQDPGQGFRVAGQLYEVDAEALARMDALERIDEPNWYERVEIGVRERHRDVPREVAAQVYFGRKQRLAMETVHLGPMAEYTLDQDVKYRGT